MGACRVCDRSGLLMSDVVGVCVGCLRNRPRNDLEISRGARRISRSRFKLPPAPPSGSITCGICGRGCTIPEGGMGYCGLVRNVGGSLERPG